MDKTNILMTKGGLMKVESIAECSPFLVFLGWLFYRGFTVIKVQNAKQHLAKLPMTLALQC